jgi:hypothetical protein
MKIQFPLPVQPRIRLQRFVASLEYERARLSGDPAAAHMFGWARKALTTQVALQEGNTVSDGDFAMMLHWLRRGVPQWLGGASGSVLMGDR